MSHGREDLPCVEKNKSRHGTVRYSAAFPRTSTAKDSPEPLVAISIGLTMNGIERGHQ
ncbi:hypothetical protein HFO42_07000 [Rhizobium leguminosarum]|uniref:Uncharacterized protein n=1 Tax=Rhizobium leguminosarum TaxID=384 RepID=A0AAJ1EG01_RHILE|nr:hypothetical protein [Rhizobium leguminosarum]MBY5520621.1 hypothetical protein [Rhizobium leguminosarum]MBY5532936.1 hypothetical protein [Rhizobium leguminosarum]MBY5547297.1 hypothetical protein [Rhizobium leguminosarum]MBY5560940.1 hypothetical protein [Rhizobium leguminosarum]MBY5587788.1 hypothetical protein [Rhizobium leguminosarum]